LRATDVNITKVHEEWFFCSLSGAKARWLGLSRGFNKLRCCMQVCL